MHITIMQNILQANAEKARHIRELLQQKKIFMINLISSPGAGKTTLLEKSLPLITQKYRAAVIEGDVATDRDAKRLEKYNVPIALINTNGACHLESVSIERALESFDLNNLDLIFVENIGNLVCPAEFDIGEHIKIAILSVAEGDDKPIKYPLLFREASLVILNKIDLLPYVNFNLTNFYTDIKNINGNIEVIELSAQTEQGVEKLATWLLRKILS